MSQAAVFSQRLCPLQSPAELISTFSALDPLVYLYNQGNPVIGCFPERYCILQSGEMQYFQATALNQYTQSQAEDFSQLIQSAHTTLDQPSFTGGVMGFIGYDHGAAQAIQLNYKTQPALFLGVFQSYLSLERDGWYFNSDAKNATEQFHYLQHALTTPTPQDFELTQACQARWNKSQYQAAFQQVQDYIVAGDCYQINLTQEFIGQAQGRLSTTAEKFWQLTQAPYAGYLRTGEFELLSCSPELFIEFNAKRNILTKPIKGTMPRFADAVLDAKSKQQLMNSEKDRAENVMIVDLLRNDLSIYAETGTVKTPKLFNIESFNQVHHMVSEVTATLKPTVKPFDVLMSALPGGSITGAPKIRAMQIIDELEQAPRGAYCGSLGYFNFDGTGSWNILIRSIQKYHSDISLWAGGGITIASNVDAEYQECFDKVEALLNLLNTWLKN
jgi:para-aminobenzoate synthetase component I